MIPYVLPDNCSPKAAKFFGVEHVSKEERSAPEPTSEVVSQLYLSAAESWGQIAAVRPRIRPQFFGRQLNFEQPPLSLAQSKSDKDQILPFDRSPEEEARDMPEKAKKLFGVTVARSPASSRADAKTSAAYICHSSPDVKSGRNSPVELNVKGIVNENAESCWV